MSVMRDRFTIALFECEDLVAKLMREKCKRAPSSPLCSTFETMGKDSVSIQKVMSWQYLFCKLWILPFTGKSNR